MRKFNVLLPTDDTEGDWEEMPWLAGQGVGLIHDIRPAKDVVETMMAGSEWIAASVVATRADQQAGYISACQPGGISVLISRVGRHRWTSRNAAQTS